MKFLKALIVEHSSLIILFSGAVSFFLSNVLMKGVLVSVDYSSYSIYITYLSLLYLFGILGSEQVFMRFSSSKEKNKIITQKSILVYITIVVFSTSILSTVIFKSFYPVIPIHFGFLFVTSFSIIGMLFLFNVLRLNLDFLWSQLVSNFWKVILLLTTFFFLIFDFKDIKWLINIISASIIVVFLATFFIILKRIRFNFQEDLSLIQVLNSAFHFFLAILSFSLITFADRFIIETKFSVQEFNNYFYLSNFFLAPFSILQNYIGFRQLLKFKNGFDKKYFFDFNKTVLKLGILLCTVLFFVFYALSKSSFFDFDYNDYLYIIIFLLLTGLMRMYSSSVLSAFEAQTTINNLRKSNFYIVLITIVVTTIAIFMSTKITSVLFCFLLIWFLRTLIYKCLILKQFEEK